jgi:hypothetical protein
MLNSCDQFRVMWDKYHKTLALTNQLVALRHNNNNDAVMSSPLPSSPSIDDEVAATMADLGVASPSSPPGVA